MGLGLLYQVGLVANLLCTHHVRSKIRHQLFCYNSLQILQQCPQFWPALSAYPGYNFHIHLYRSCYIDPLKRATWVVTWECMGTCPGHYSACNKLNIMIIVIIIDIMAHPYLHSMSQMTPIYISYVNHDILMLTSSCTSTIINVKEDC